MQSWANMTKQLLLITPSRPITYIKRDTPACAEIPDAITATTAKYKTNVLNAMLPIAATITGCDSSNGLK